MRIRKQDISFVHYDAVSQLEPIVLDYIESLNLNSVFYDLGSCLGYFSLYASKLGLQVYAFEADPENFLGLSKNISANKLDITPYNIAITDGLSEQVQFMIGQPGIGGHRKTVNSKNFCASDEIQRVGYKKITVPANNLDNIILRDQLPFPDHIKVDIDGSEYDFLISSPKVLTHSNSMIIELYKNSDKFTEMISIIENYGFVFYREEQLNNGAGCESLYNMWFKK